MSALKRNPFTKGVISKPIFLLGIVLSLSIVAMGASVLYTGIQQAYQQQYLELVSEQKLLSQRIATFALEAAAGKETAFAQLEKYRNRFDETLKIFANGNPDRELPPLPSSLHGAVAEVQKVWQGDPKISNDTNGYRNNVNRIIAGKLAISEVGEFVLVIQEFIPQLLSFSEEVVDLLVERNAN